MIRQLLDFSAIAARARAHERRPVSPAPSTRSTGRRAPRRITIATELGDDPLLVSADEHQIQQALVNLLVNAMQAMPDGRRIERHDRRAPRASRVSTIARGRLRRHPSPTHGPGSPRAPAAPLRALLHHQGARQGTGLGLSVAHGIVRDHGGWIAVEAGRARRSFRDLAPRRVRGKAPPHRAA